MPSDVDTAARRWSERSQTLDGKQTGASWWEAGPELLRYINRGVSGDPSVDWVEYTLAKHLAGRLPLSRCLSLACGEGGLERKLARRRAFEQCDAVDVSPGSISVAQRKAREEHADNITYRIADINQMRLQAHIYDVVWANAAMHHFGNLENVCSQVKASLRPDGLFILNEYVGPNRFQFPERQKEIANLCLRLLPTRYRAQAFGSLGSGRTYAPHERKLGWLVVRVLDKIRDGDLLGVARRRVAAFMAKAKGQTHKLNEVDFPTAQSVIRQDPTEAVRSQEIVAVLQQHFEIVERKGWGGSLAQFVLSGIAHNFSESDPQSQDLLRMLLDIEATLIRCGELQSDYAYIVARPLRS